MYVCAKRKRRKKEKKEMALEKRLENPTFVGAYRFISINEKKRAFVMRRSLLVDCGFLCIFKPSRTFRPKKWNLNRKSILL